MMTTYIQTYIKNSPIHRILEKDMRCSIYKIAMHDHAIMMMMVALMIICVDALGQKIGCC